MNHSLIITYYLAVYFIWTTIFTILNPLCNLESLLLFLNTSDEAFLLPKSTEKRKSEKHSLMY